ncbi:hypothetical protein FOXYSP1_04823 [Fusarium oxysporum f. sp. phaseoli]
MLLSRGLSRAVISTRWLRNVLWLSRWLCRLIAREREFPDRLTTSKPGHCLGW